MKRRDIDKLRRLDPKLAAQLEGVLARRGDADEPETPTEGAEAAEGSPEGGSELGECSPAPQAPQRCEETAGAPCPASQPTEAPETAVSASEPCAPPSSPDPSARFAEGYQTPLLPLSYYETDSQCLLLSEGCTAPTPEELDTAETQGEIDELLAEMQEALPLGQSLSAGKRSAESQALPTWQLRSTRRNDAKFEHSPEHRDVQEMTDRMLGKRWGQLSRNRGRGLSDRDQAIQREVYARSLGIDDLYGLDGHRPGASGPIYEAMRRLGCGTGFTVTVVGLLELMVSKGRMAVRLSAADAHTLWGWSRSGWWRTIRRLENLGLIQRVRGLKPNEHGAAPVQTDTNLYVLGPWWFESEDERAPTPLQMTMGLLAKLSTGVEDRAAKAGHHDLMRRRRERRRTQNQQSRDRNRRRHHALPPKVTSVEDVDLDAEVERLSRARTAQARADVDAHYREMAEACVSGGSVAIGDEPLRRSKVEDSGAAERAAEGLIRAVNQRRVAEAKLRRKEMGRQLRRLCSSPKELPSTFGSGSPKGKNERKNSSRYDTPYPPPTPTGKPTTPLRRPPQTLPSPKAGNNESLEQNPSARARALERKGSTTDSPKTDHHALQGPAFFRQAFANVFGHTMETDQA